MLQESPLGFKLRLNETSILSDFTSFILGLLIKIKSLSIVIILGLSSPETVAPSDGL